MKSKKIIMKIFTIIISFILLISMFISVDASGYVKFEDVNTVALSASDTSGIISPINRVVNFVIPLLRYLTLILGIFMLVYGIKILVKNKQKRGIIYIIISLALLFACIMLSLIHICNHNIEA